MENPTIGNNCRIFFFIFLGAASTTCFALSFLELIHFSLYSCFLVLYFSIQIVSALLNRGATVRFPASNKPVTILVAGYRENPEYWRKCLVSIRNQDYPYLRGVIISIDGDEEQDQYMKDIANEVFYPEAPSATLQQLQSHDDFHEISMVEPLSSRREISILLNPHGGKREAIWYGMRHLRNSGDPATFTMFMDSDTVLNRDATRHLVNCIDSSEKNGCATGSLLIFDQHFLGKIINARYAYAFNLERAALSYYGVMNCCSGPLSIYRSAVLDEAFMEEFRTQTFLGTQVGPGDDRHLTMMLMNRGYTSRQTHLSVAYTEAPETLVRFIKQQTRWLRSFFREQWWQIGAIRYQHIFLGLVTQYEILYPMFVLSWIVRSFFFTDRFQLVTISSFTVGIILIRTCLLMILQKSLDFWYNLFYLPIFITMVLPLKIYCLFTLHHMSWITSSRLTIINRCDLEMAIIGLLILAWNTLLVVSVVKKI